MSVEWNFSMNSKTTLKLFSLSLMNAMLAFFWKCHFWKKDHVKSILTMPGYATLVLKKLLFARKITLSLSADTFSSCKKKISLVRQAFKMLVKHVRQLVWFIIYLEDATMISEDEWTKKLKRRFIFVTCLYLCVFLINNNSTNLIKCLSFATTRATKNNCFIIPLIMQLFGY